jgi:anti-anti-sigma factor
MRRHASQSAPGPSELEIRTHGSGRECTVELLGQLNPTTHELAAEALEQALEQDTDTIVLDLTGLKYIDRAGVRAILIAHQRASDQRKQFLIVPGPSAVQHVLDAVHGPFSYTHHAIRSGQRCGR